MKFIVISPATHSAKLMDKYTAQLAAAGIPHLIPHWDDFSSASDGTIERCVRSRRLWAEKHVDYDRLIFTDSWDVLCYASRDEIEATLSGMTGTVVFGAEKNCYPEPELAALIPDRGPWRYVNGGLMTGSPQEIIKWCDVVEHHPKYTPSMIDQQWYNRRLAELNPIISIDWQTSLFYCMILEAGELAVKDGRPYNTVHQTFPSFIHFNGSWSWDNFLAMMEHP